MGKAREPLLGRALLAVGLGALLLVVLADPSAAVDIGTIRFPDTAPGTSSTLACEEMIGLCFATNCSGSGRVESVSGVNPPFSITKLNRLTLSQFVAGVCEANPVNLPVEVGPGQVLGFQGTFSPTEAGTYTAAVTFSTPGGPATYNLTGKAVAPGLGLITIAVSPERIIVPGNRTEISYQISPGSLTGNVDVYFGALVPGTGQYLFLDENGDFGPAIVPFRRNVAPAEQTAVLLSLFPVDLPFGQYELLMGLVHAGEPGSLDTLASPLALTSVTFAPLSDAQQATLRQHGNPDSYSMFWLAEGNQKREMWLYLSGEPRQFAFLNGILEGLTTLTDPPAGGAPKVDPGLFTPQTSRAQLTASFGSPTSEFAFEGFDLLSYPGGLDVIFRAGRLSSVTTVTP